MNFHPIRHVRKWFESAAHIHAALFRRYPDAVEPPHHGWTGRSLAIEAALTTGLDGSTGALVSLWRDTDSESDRAHTFIPEWQKSYIVK
jgi:hypothetical protein